MASTLVNSETTTTKVAVQEHSNPDDSTSDDTTTRDIIDSTTFESSTFISTEDTLTVHQSDRHKFILWRLENTRRNFYNRPTNPAKMPNIRVFSGSSHPDLAAHICERLGRSIFMMTMIFFYFFLLFTFCLSVTEVETTSKYCKSCSESLPWSIHSPSYMKQRLKFNSCHSCSYLASCSLSF